MSQTPTVEGTDTPSPYSPNQDASSVTLYVTLATLRGCSIQNLCDESHLTGALRDACQRAQFTELQISVKTFEPEGSGVTGVAIIGESHVAIHTWPEHGSLFLDIASCSTYESTQRALEAVQDAFPGSTLVRRDDIIHES